MSKAFATREPAHPLSRQDRETILAELQEVLASPHFCNSKRYPALLQYIVEKTLAGEADHLKERTLGVEVFDRAPAYDTNADTVVRYTAGEVRKRLALYYSELGSSPRIRISLPAGSYVPEFLHEQDQHEHAGDAHAHLSTHLPSSGLFAEAEGQTLEYAPLSGLAEATSLSVSMDGERHGFLPLQTPAKATRWWWLALAAVAVVVLAAGAAWKYRAAPARTPLDSFWLPVLQNQSSMPVCIGGSVFSLTHTSGVATATKDVDYPFVSMQSVSAVAQLSALLERSGGVTTQLQPAATTPLTELREHPVILVGAYNNPWTLRLVEPLRFHFAPVDQDEAIVDAAHPGVRWERDPSLPYSSADDYALVARFRSPTTDSWVIVLAGVGRNGSEAAAQFATSSHYMQLLRDQAGTDLSNRNVEAVLKVSVIDGKTGAPSIQAVHVW